MNILPSQFHKCLIKIYRSSRDGEESRSQLPNQFPDQASHSPEPGRVATNWLMTNIRGWPLVSTLALTLRTARHSFSRRKSLRDRRLFAAVRSTTRTSPLLPQSLSLHDQFWSHNMLLQLIWSTALGLICQNHIITTQQSTP